MYCPQCEGEYRPGIMTCPTCEVPLVENLGEVPPPRFKEPRLAPELIDLVGFTDEHEARDARQRLREAKIPCELVIRDAHGLAESEDAGGEPGDAPWRPRSAFGDRTPAAGSDEGPRDEFWIRVPGTKAHAAADVLHLDSGIAEDTCPSCGAPIEGEGDCPKCGYRLEHD